jgi:hypothetical protein
MMAEHFKNKDTVAVNTYRKLIETLEIFLIVHRLHKCAFSIWKKSTNGLPYLPDEHCREEKENKRCIRTVYMSGYFRKTVSSQKKKTNERKKPLVYRILCRNIPSSTLNRPKCKF